MSRTRTLKKEKVKYPIKHWSHSSLMAFLRNPLAWYKRYVEEVFDALSSPAGIVGRAGHLALEHFYSGAEKEVAIKLGLSYLRNVRDFEVNFGTAHTARAKKAKRKKMEHDYLQAISFYLTRPPKHTVLGVEVKGTVTVAGLALPLKAVSDLVVECPIEKGAIDVIDHKFVDSFSKQGATKSLFIIQAIFNYYTARELFMKPVRRFIVYECKKTKNADGSPQMRRYILDYQDHQDEFRLFHRLIRDATAEISRPRLYLPNPSDMFEGENSFDIYRLDLAGKINTRDRR